LTEVLAVFGPARTTEYLLIIGIGIPANQLLGKPGLLGLFTTLGALSSVATNTQIMHILLDCLIGNFAPKSRGQKYWRLNVGEEIPEWKEKTTPL
jgi:hypothetical protein